MLTTAQVDYVLYVEKYLLLVNYSANKVKKSKTRT